MLFQSIIPSEPQKLWPLNGLSGDRQKWLGRGNATETINMSVEHKRNTDTTALNANENKWLGLSCTVNIQNRHVLQSRAVRTKYLGSFRLLHRLNSPRNVS